MPLRRGVDIAPVLRRDFERHPRLPENGLRVAQLGLDCGDRPPLNEVASADCAERVAHVLGRLGYGFNVIARGSSAPKRA
jgi:hypothetical protein